MSFTTAPPLRCLKGAPRGCGAVVAPRTKFCRGALPLLGEVPSAHTGERGRRGTESAIWEKKEQSLENLCHSETSDRRHWSWESVSFSGRQYIYAWRIGDADCRVASLLAMTGGFDSVLSFLPCSRCHSGDPSVDLTVDSSPSRGAKRERRRFAA